MCLNFISDSNTDAVRVLSKCNRTLRFSLDNRTFLKEWRRGILVQKITESNKFVSIELCI